jgi:hypothetical protein
VLSLSSIGLQIRSAPSTTPKRSGSTWPVSILASQTANLVALQAFASRRLFLKAGFGLAQVIKDDTPYSWGGAGMIGIGYELIQSWNWSFDIEATATAARYNTNGDDQNWANWSLVNFAINFY